MAIYVDAVYGNHDMHSSVSLIVATWFFSFQIYCDFSGYSDIAIGTSRMFGIRLMENFNLPNFAHSFSNFWRRWHISLSTWFRDYLYIPLGGNRKTEAITYFNIAITMIIAGLWHGASFTFVAWGVLHALFLIAEKILKNISSMQFRFPIWIKTLIMFQLVSFAWIFFRSDSIKQSFEIVSKIFSLEGLDLNVLNPGMFAIMIYGCIVLFLLEFFLLSKNDIKNYAIRSPYATAILSAFLILNIILFGNASGNQFIYFQF